ETLSFSAEGLLETPIKLELSTNQTRPAEQVTVSVHTNPSAFVGVLGVDQSLLLLRTGNDLSMADIKSDLQDYENTYYRHNRRFTRDLDYFNQPGSNLFAENGLLFISN